MYSTTCIAGWADMDYNGHMKNTAFLDKAADVRLLYFKEQGFAVTEFARLRIGPVVVRDEIDYRKEVHLHEELTLGLALAGVSDDGSRWLLQSDVLRQTKLCARVRASGAWLDLDARKLVVPPPALYAALIQLDRTADYAPLRGAVRGN